MWIDVQLTAGGFDEQTRAYAEFRIFSALATFGRQIDVVTVALTRPPNGDPAVTCAISIRFAGGGHLRIRSRGGHASDAIDRGVNRIADLVSEGHQVAPPRSKRPLTWQNDDDDDAADSGSVMDSGAVRRGGGERV